VSGFDPSRTRRALRPRLLLLATAMFVVATNGFVIAGLLPQIARDFDVHISDVGYAITFYAATVAVTAPVTSILFARVSRTMLMVAGMALVAVGTLVAALSPDLALFVGGRIIAAIGGAAIVPIGTAAAAALAAPEHRGRAIGIVVAGFTASIAFGAPLGTALAGLGGWRTPLLVLAALALVVAAALAFTVRHVPIDPPVGLGRRFAALGNSRLLLTLLTTVFALAGFNIVYIFSSSVVHHATGGDAGLLALLLLTYGVAGLVGNAIGGQLTDRIGPRRTSAIFIGAIVVVLAAMPTLAVTLPGALASFALWGVAGSGSLPAIQYRLITVDPAVAGVALSWNSTALYIGIAFAPVVGAAALHAGGPGLVPLVGASAAAVALLLFQLSWVLRRRTSEG
jgi:DHA1 family inner membrane transport protein